MRALYVCLIAATLLLSSSSADAFKTFNPGCGILCNNDSDCSNGNLFRNPCAYCGRSGTCEQICGAGCRQDSDCRPPGEGNPCTTCNLQTRQCVNPTPLCGSFCGNTASACLVNGTGQCASGGGYSGCCTCTDNGCMSAPQPTNTCGTICSNTGECLSDSNCSQCVGYYCSPPQACGQVCISSGQCENNDSGCKSCRFSTCQQGGACGAACGGDGDCDQSSCAVCGNDATCVSSQQYRTELEGLDQMSKEALLKQGMFLRSEAIKKYTPVKPKL